ncbi:hypothetical protein P167DRAFT_202055 [Morchella conica CCBAS932]|uniref:Uncharacterized protein n=1 Tax=Morchella conica CCBAS932 TaxID=1392247 RepID=A0A3N4L2B5_9PEZI|nr:hypothetical protein P167DRAFT_202055 [Morchella conica CCBAS932]
MLLLLLLLPLVVVDKYGCSGIGNMTALDGLRNDFCAHFLGLQIDMRDADEHGDVVNDWEYWGYWGVWYGMGVWEQLLTMMMMMMMM